MLFLSNVTLQVIELKDQIKKQLHSFSIIISTSKVNALKCLSRTILTIGLLLKWICCIKIPSTLPMNSVLQ